MKRNFILTVLVIFTTLFANAQISKSDADRLILNMLGNDSTIIVYGMSGSLNRNNSIITADGNELLNPYENSYVYFIDDIPAANWAHPCRYCFLNIVNGEIHFEHQSFYPLDHESFICINETDNYDDNRSWPYDYSYTIPQKATPKGNLYAVLIGGHPGTHSSLKIWYNLSCVYTSLVNRYGFMEYDGVGPRHIIVTAYSTVNSTRYDYWGTTYLNDLNHSGGFSDSEDFIDPNEIPYNKNGIRDIFRNLAGTINTTDEIPELSENDQLFVFICGHGNTENGSSYFKIEDNESNNIYKLYDYELTSWVRDIKCSQMTFMIDCCYSGGFIDDLMNDNNAVCKNRAVHTSTDAYHYGWVEEHITRRNRYEEQWQRVDEFVYYWSAASLGYYPILEDHVDSLVGPWYKFGGTSIGQFPWNLITSFHEGDGYSHLGYDVNPDTNYDGIVTMDEAFVFADNLDSYSHNGYFNPINYVDNMGDSCVEYPRSSYESTFTKELITLDGYKGTIDGNATTGTANHYILDGNVLISYDAALKIKDGIVINGKNNNLTNYGLVFTEDNLLNARFKRMGISNVMGGELILSHCLFDTCGTIEAKDSPITITSSTFNQTNIIATTTETPRIYYNTILNSNTFNSTLTEPTIHLKDIPQCTINSNVISSGGDGIMIKGLSNTYLNYVFANNIIRGCEGSGFVAYASNGKLRSNSITGNAIDGLRSLNLSDLYIKGDTAVTLLEDAQKISRNERYQVYATNNSYPQDFHYNLLRGNGTNSDYILYYETSQPQNSTPVMFDVSKNCWNPLNDSDIPSHLYVYGNGTFDYLPTWTPSSSPFHPGGPLSKLSLGNDLADNGDYDGAVEVFMQLVSDYPESQEAISALKAMFAVTKISCGDFSDLKDYYLELVSNTYLGDAADNLANRCDVELGNYSIAIDWYENKIDNPNTSYSERIFAEIDLGDLYLKMQNNVDRGVRGKHYEFIPVSIESHNKRTEQLLAMLPENMNINNMTDNVKTVIKDSNSMQIVCCPNPTNETLTLSYILEFDTNVDISIYGILGNRLKYINLGKQNGGSQSCNIDVSDLHSGIYFCNIQTNDGIIKSIKIVVEH